MWEWEFILMYKIHCHFSTRLEKPQKKTIKNHVCISLHREALSVIRCVLLQAYSYWYLLQRREKRSTLSSNGNPFMYIFNTPCGAKRFLCHWSEKTAVWGYSKMGNNKSIPRLCFMKSEHHFPASGEEQCRYGR